MEARFSASWNWPWLVAPSPKKQTATAPLFFTEAVSAAPVASGMPAPTIPFAPSIP
jgi:hypothetical protein